MGLPNFGKTCYLNSALQLLFSSQHSLVTIQKGACDSRADGLIELVRGMETQVVSSAPGLGESKDSDGRKNPASHASHGF